jgi:hypothetical protein
VVDPVSGRAYPAPIPRSPRPVPRDAFGRDSSFEGGAADRGGFDRGAFQRGAPERSAHDRDAYDRDAYDRAAYDRDAAYERDLQAREAYGRDIRAPRHLADNWEGPVSLNRALPSRRHGLQWLLAIPIIPPLLVPLYNRLEPRLFGVPFFYWYQLACVFLAIGVVGLVYQLTKGRRPRWPR